MNKSSPDPARKSVMKERLHSGWFVKTELLGRFSLFLVSNGIDAPNTYRNRTA